MKNDVVRALKFLKIGNAELDSLVEVPKDPKMGDYALPCFIFARKLKKSPEEIAKDISSKVKSNNFEKIEASGPYVNFYVNSVKLAGETIKIISKEGDKYGSNNHSNEKVMIEFSDPNTHKAFHIGHIRGTSLGESLSRIMEFCGNIVIRANYSGDTGMHIAKWIWCYQKYHSREELKKDEKWFAEIYVDAVKRLTKNEKLQEEVEEVNRKLDSLKDKKLNDLWKKTRKMSIDSWTKIYSELNTKFDVHYFESEFEKKGKEIVEGLVKRKIAKLSDGAIIIDFGKKLGVLVFLRGDGTILYGGKDLALAERKFKDYKLSRSIYVVGDEQSLYLKQLFATLELMKFKHAGKSEHVIYNLIRLPWGKMSSRTGDNVLYSEFKEKMQKLAAKEVEKRYNLESVKIYDRALAITIAALKYSMLKQDSRKNIIFDPGESLSFEGDTGPYLLYSYARGQSILRKAEYKKTKKLDIVDVNDYEKRLVSELARFPAVVEHAYTNLAPNSIANYSYELARVFSEFYSECRVIGDEKEQFRLNLVDSFSQTIKNALNLLGINVIEEM